MKKQKIKQGSFGASRITTAPLVKQLFFGGDPARVNQATEVLKKFKLKLKYYNKSLASRKQDYVVVPSGDKLVSKRFLDFRNILISLNRLGTPAFIQDNRRNL